MNKKGQVTISIITGVVLLITTLFALLIFAEVRTVNVATVNSETNYDIDYIINYEQICIEETLSDAILLTGLNEEHIEEFIKDNLKCDYSFIRDQGFKITLLPIEPNLTIINDNMFLEIEKPIKITNNNNNSEYVPEKFNIKFSLKSYINISLDENEIATENMILVSDEGSLILIIPKGTKVQIPLGASKDNISLELIDISGGPEGSLAYHVIYKLKPSGIKFSPSVELRINYKDSYFNNEDLQIKILNYYWEPLSSQVNTESNYVKANISYFFMYVLWANETTSPTLRNPTYFQDVDFLPNSTGGLINNSLACTNDDQTVGKGNSQDYLSKFSVDYVHPQGFDFSWGFIQESEDGVYNFGNNSNEELRTLDASLKWAKEKNVNYYIEFWPYAEWDQIKCRNSNCRQDYNEEMGMFNFATKYICNPCEIDNYAAFVREMVERYDGDYDFGESNITREMKKIIIENPILSWSLMNELERNFAYKGVGSTNMGEKALAYAELLKTTSSVIKNVCPECMILTAGTEGVYSQDEQEFLNTFFSIKDIDQYFDVISLHYGESSNKGNDSRMKSLGMETYSDLIEDYGLSHKSTWLTSIFPSKNNRTEQNYAFLYSIGTVNALSDGASMMCYAGVNEIPELSFSLLTENGTTLAFDALKIIISEINFLKNSTNKQIREKFNERMIQVTIDFDDGKSSYIYWIEETDRELTLIEETQKSMSGGMDRDVDPGIGAYTVRDMYDNVQTIQSGKKFTLSPTNFYIVKSLN